LGSSPRLAFKEGDGRSYWYLNPASIGREPRLLVASGSSMPKRKRGGVRTLTYDPVTFAFEHILKRKGYIEQKVGAHGSGTCKSNTATRTALIPWKCLLAGSPHEEPRYTFLFRWKLSPRSPMGNLYARCWIVVCSRREIHHGDSHGVSPLWFFLVNIALLAWSSLAFVPFEILGQPERLTGSIVPDL